ncbi:MAG: hypothetical protein AB7H77_11410, partial [Bdellovibrionales bacterium]
ASSPREIASALFNIASPCVYMVVGHRNFGVSLGGILGIIGTFLAVYPEIAAGRVISIFAFAFFCFFVSLGIFSAPLTRRYSRSKSRLLRETLGHPRRLGGLGPFFLTRLPIIWISLMDGRPKIAIVFAIWALGDVAYSFSRAKT